MDIRNHAFAEKKLDALYASYWERVEHFAGLVFSEILKPWLIKYSLEFIAGNGDFNIYCTKKTPRWFVRKYVGYGYNPNLAIDIEKLPKSVQKWLTLSPVNYGYPLASIMQYFHPEKEV